MKQLISLVRNMYAPITHIHEVIKYVQHPLTCLLHCYHITITCSFVLHRSSVLSGEWAIPHASKLKYKQMFNTYDRQKAGVLTGPQARNILMQFGLPQGLLAQIW